MIKNHKIELSMYNTALVFLFLFSDLQKNYYWPVTFKNTLRQWNLPSRTKRKVTISPFICDGNTDEQLLHFMFQT